MDVSLADIQCGGYAEGGIVGSEPAKLEATAAAGSDVTLQWTLWPDSHIGPTVTYLAKCPDAGEYGDCSLQPVPATHTSQQQAAPTGCPKTAPSGSKSPKMASAPTAHGARHPS